MVSNDVEALGPGEACQALLLTAKARLIAPLTVLRRGPGRLPAPHRAVPRRPRHERAAPLPLRGEMRDRGRGARPRRSCSASRLRTGAVPTPDYGVPAYELLDAAEPAAVPDRRRRARATADPAPAPLRGGSSSTTACSRRKRASRSARSASRRGATRGRSRWPGSTIAAIRTGACASSSSRATTCPPTTPSSPSTARPVGRITSAVADGGRRPRARLRTPRGPRRRRPPPRLPGGDAATLFLPAPVAQGIERCPAEAEVARSNRAGRIAVREPRVPIVLDRPRSRWRAAPKTSAATRADSVEPALVVDRARAAAAHLTAAEGSVKPHSSRERRGGRLTPAPRGAAPQERSVKPCG